MPRRNTLVFLIVLAIFVVAALVVFPIEKGTWFKKGIRLGLDLQGGTRIIYSANLAGIAAGDVASTMDGTIAVLTNRINPMGVSETSIRTLGENQILVEIPGRTLTDKEKEGLSRVALLEFAELTTDNASARWDNELGKWKPVTGIIGGETKELTSRYFKKNTYVSRDNLNQIRLEFEWDTEGSQLSEQITTRLLNQPLAIFEGNEPLRGADNRPIAPYIRATITNRGEITGLSMGDATSLSQQLNAGRLPVPLTLDPTSLDIPASLGNDFFKKSLRAGMLGILMTMLFMTIYYRVSGLMASLALAYYAFLTLAIFKLLGVTLTLAGIAGFILSVGMAIDANVLIFERMKEEMWAGRSLGAAIDAGFNRAWPAILDSNVTTILAGVILYWLGNSNIIASDVAKGFAVTLMIGVAVSMFTAITVTRTFVRAFAGTTLAQNTSLFAPYQRKINV
ncbi:MAG: preprotein translocase subunit SecD [Dehalococcoidales bacterium]|nr:preprotein translocase subunit SecD [Dehalococcoidales bacterium]